MKLRLFSICVCLLICIAYVYSQENKELLPDSIVDKMKAVIAVDLNRISMKEQSGKTKSASRTKAEKTLKALEKEFKNVEEVKNVIDENIYKSNVKLCDEINIISTHGLTSDEARKLFVEGLYEYEPIQRFMNKSNRSKQKDSLKTLVKDKINGILRQYNEQRAMVRPKPKIEEKTETRQKESSFIDAIQGRLWIVCLFLIGCVAYLVWKTIVDSKEILKLLSEKDKLKKASEMEINKRVKEIESVRHRLEKSYREQEMLKKDIEVLRERLIAQEKRGIQHLATDDEETMKQEKQSAAKEIAYRKPIYVGIPEENYFSDESPFYRNGQSLCVITPFCADEGYYQFADHPEVLLFCKSSKSSFIKPVCDIVNDDVSSFNKIRTIEKGHVEKRNQGWYIVKKAKVELI